MSVPLHTSTTKIGWSAEANYAGGVAGIKYAMTQVANNASLTSMNMIKGDLNLGISETERVGLKPPTSTPDSRVMFNQGYRYKEFTVEQYIQNETWAALAGASITPGTLPTSYVFHCEIMGVAGVLTYFDIFGCTLIEYEISVNEKEFPTERLTFRYFDIGTGVAHNTLSGLLTTQPSTHKDIALTIDSDSIVDLISCSFKITFDTIDKHVATKYQRFDPHIISREVELDATFYSDKAGVLGDELAIAGTLVEASTIEVPVVLTYISTSANLSAAKMYVDTSSIGQVPSEMGFYEINVKMKMGASCTIAHNT